MRERERAPRVDLALVHHPVVNRKGERIGAAVTNLDVHDIARAACTYGVGNYWIVTPHEEQRRLAAQIVDHWTTGYGRAANPDRGLALSRIRLAVSLEEVIAEATAGQDQRPKVIATSASADGATLSFSDLRAEVQHGMPVLLLFGTAWGLAPEILANADAVLEPLRGSGDFNHLSVRSAASIILDRLLAPAASHAFARETG